MVRYRLMRAKLNKAIKDNVEGVANLVSAYGKSFKVATDRLIGSSGILAAQTEKGAAHDNQELRQAARGDQCPYGEY